MINISMDEKACVGCTLCVDTCPTQVFTFDAARDLPQVAKPQECFGCLSCSEICPASALEHQGLERSRSFYHDPYALEVARKSTTTPLEHNVIEDEAGRGGALQDLAVRLLSVAVVLKDIVGTGLAPVGLMAGRSLATQLPRYRPPKDLMGATELAKKEFSPAWGLAFKHDGNGSLQIDVGACFVRDLCAKEGIPLGGELCVLFCNYLSGYLGRMGKKQLRLASADRGAAACSYAMKILN